MRRDINIILHSELPVKDIVLFGSCAGGSLKSTSDLDLLIITEQNIDMGQKVMVREMIDKSNSGVDTGLVFYKSDIFRKCSRYVYK